MGIPERTDLKIHVSCLLVNYTEERNNRNFAHTLARQTIKHRPATTDQQTHISRHKPASADQNNKHALASTGSKCRSAAILFSLMAGLKSAGPENTQLACGSQMNL